jgi:hypothetical protein
MSAESNDLEKPHARGHLEILRTASVVKRFMIGKFVVRGSAGAGGERHDAVAGTAAASSEHRRSQAATQRIAAKT